LGPSASRTSGDDVAVLTRFAGVGGEGSVGGEVLIALDGQPEWAAQIPQFVHAHESKLLRSFLHRRPSGPPKVGSKRLLPF
jgi:hypothetical protein